MGWGTHRVRRILSNGRPFVSAIRDGKNVAQLIWLEGDTLNTGFVQQFGDVEQSPKIKARSGFQVLPDFGGKPMLALDPSAVLCRFESVYASLPQRRGGVSTYK